MPTPTPIVRKLVLVWAAVFLLDLVARMFGVGLDQLGFSPRGLLDGHGTALLGLFTHPFVHADLVHVFFNALLFLILAPEVEVLFPGRRMVRLLAYAAGAGALAAVLLTLLSAGHGDARIVGGSGMVMAAVAAHAAVYPGRRLSMIVISFSVRTFFLVLLTLNVLGLIATLAGTAAGVAYEIHLAGAAVGYAYAGGFGSLPSPWRR